VVGLLLPSVSWEMSESTLADDVSARAGTSEPELEYELVRAAISELTLDDDVSVSADISGSEVEAAVVAAVDASALGAPPPWWW
jgi:hypothetical protein